MADTSSLNLLPRHPQESVQGPPILSSGLDKPENADLREAFAAWEPEPVVEEEAPADLPAAPETAQTKPAHRPETDPIEPPAELAEKPQEKEPSFERRVRRA